MKIHFYATSQGAQQGQLQTLGIEDLKEEAGVDRPLSKTRRLRYTVETKQGEVELVQGDSHAVWPKHQATAEARSFIDSMVSGLKKIPSRAYKELSKDEKRAVALANSREFEVKDITFEDITDSQGQVEAQGGNEEALSAW